MTQEQLNQAFYESIGWTNFQKCNCEPGCIELVGTRPGIKHMLITVPNITIDTVRNAVMELSEYEQGMFDDKLLASACETNTGFHHQLTASDWRDCYLKTIGKI